MSEPLKDLDRVEINLSGVIVGDSAAPHVYDVELFDPDGMTIDVLSLPAEALKRPGEWRTTNCRCPYCNVRLTVVEPENKDRP